MELFNFITLEHESVDALEDHTDHMLADFFAIEKDSGCAQHGKHQGKSGACVHRMADDFALIGMEKDSGCAQHGKHQGKSGACVHR
jgi:hypothetical protein